jgi:hypothetical protein
MTNLMKKLTKFFTETETEKSLQINTLASISEVMTLTRELDVKPEAFQAYAQTDITLVDQLRTFTLGKFIAESDSMFARILKAHPSQEYLTQLEVCYEICEKSLAEKVLMTESDNVSLQSVMI